MSIGSRSGFVPVYLWRADVLVLHLKDETFDPAIDSMRRLGADALGDMLLCGLRSTDPAAGTRFGSGSRGGAPFTLAAINAADPCIECRVARARIAMLEGR